MTSGTDIINEARLIQSKLQDDCSRARQKIELFVKRNSDKAHEIKSNSEKIVKHRNYEILKSQEDFKNVQAQLALIKNELQQEQNAEVQLQQSINDLKSKEAELPQKLEEIRSQYAAQAQHLLQKKQEFFALQQERQNTLQRQSLLSSVFEQHLGMEFQPQQEQGVLRIVFKRVDAANPDRCFSFWISVGRAEQPDGTSRGRYHVSRVEPEIQYQAILEDLNRTNNFSLFIVRMRRSFEQLCALR